MIRHTDWTVRLTDFVKSKKHTPFEWGVNDCCLFVADMALAITGVDPAATFRGKYKSELGAMKQLKKQGFDSVEAVLTHAFGSTVSRLEVRRGDVVLFENDGRDIAGVMFGEVLAPGEYGIETFSPLLIKNVWRVG
ncbi:DUF6950 family protein [Alteromonas sp. KUL150]|uniref:DUF6950 family protein n=1 Tax=unclassified Alteromonas TaxID=2614992 RepID=UPI0012E4E739|nr:hypothetical protein [Alteromonas sp. KUL150]GFD85102.1 hypothetical protein KUL150_11610 [Alteromonas sp. KUL150]